MCLILSLDTENNANRLTTASPKLSTKPIHSSPNVAQAPTFSYELQNILQYETRVEITSNYLPNHLQTSRLTPQPPKWRPQPPNHKPSPFPAKPSPNSLHTPTSSHTSNLPLQHAPPAARQHNHVKHISIPARSHTRMARPSCA